MIALGSDGVFRWPSLQLAAAQAAHGAATYVYLFEWESPAFGGVLGSCHALELPFVFGVVDVPAVQLFTGGGVEVKQLSTQMQQAWLAFAHSGDPRTRVEGGWPPWDPRKRTTMVFGHQTGAVDGPRNEELSVWERYRPLFAPPVPDQGRWQKTCQPTTPQAARNRTRDSHDPSNHRTTCRGPTNLPAESATAASHTTVLPASASHTTVPGRTVDVIVVSRRAVRTPGTHQCRAMPRRGGPGPVGIGSHAR